MGIALLMLALWGLYRVYRPHENAAAEVAVASLAATDLYEDFAKSETNAGNKWIGKVIEIHGIISSIVETGNMVSISLRGRESGGINCSIRKKDFDLRKRLKPGELIYIKGKCTGFLIDVDFVDCVIQ